MFKNRAATFKSMRVKAPVDGYKAGKMYLHNDTVILVIEDLAAGQEGAGIYASEKIVLPKATNDSWSEGDKIYFDAAAGVITSDDDSAQNPCIGRATKAAGAAATEAEIDFRGDATV